MFSAEDLLYAGTSDGRILVYRITDAGVILQHTIKCTGASEINKIYFDNGVQGPTSYRYNLTSAKVTFEINASVIEEISRETFNTGNAEVIDFFERTVMSIIDELTPYMLYYLMLKANFIIQRSEFTGTEMHLFSTAKDGTKTDLGVLNQIHD